MSGDALRSWILITGLLLAEFAAVAGPPERTWLQTDVPPERRSGRVLLPLRPAAAALGATVVWNPDQRQAVLTRDGSEVMIHDGDRQAIVNGQPILLDVAPFVRNGRLLIPVRFAAQVLRVPIRYEAATESVLLGPGANGTLWLLPLQSMRRGIVLHSPEPNAEITSPVRVHGQANEFEGNVVVQLRDDGGQLLAEGVGTGAMGAWGPFTVELAYSQPRDSVATGQIIAYAPSAKDGHPLDTVTIPVRLR